MRRLTSIVLACVMATGVACNNVGHVEAKESVESIVAGMSVEQKLSQMIIPSFRTFSEYEECDSDNKADK